MKETLLEYDRTLLVADPRRNEPKKAGGRGARAKKQSSFRWVIYFYLLRLIIYSFKFIIDNINNGYFWLIN